MRTIQSGELPQVALLGRYCQQGFYTDCYFVDIPHTVSQTEYIEAFYTTWIFRIERGILALLASKHSSDAQVEQLAREGARNFAAWHVEDRATNQLLLCDFLGRTRSWLMSVADKNGDMINTRLYFGSAVTPKIDPASGRQTLGFAFQALLGFHKLYSRMLLNAASSRLLRKRARQ